MVSFLFNSCSRAPTMRCHVSSESEEKEREGVGASLEAAHFPFVSLFYRHSQLLRCTVLRNLGEALCAPCARPLPMQRGKMNKRAYLVTKEKAEKGVEGVFPGDLDRECKTKKRRKLQDLCSLLALSTPRRKKKSPGPTGFRLIVSHPIKVSLFFYKWFQQSLSAILHAAASRSGPTSTVAVVVVMVPAPGEAAALPRRSLPPLPPPPAPPPAPPPSRLSSSSPATAILKARACAAASDTDASAASSSGAGTGVPRTAAAKAAEVSSSSLAPALPLSSPPLPSPSPLSPSSSSTKRATRRCLALSERPKVASAAEI